MRGTAGAGLYAGAQPMMMPASQQSNVVVSASSPNDLSSMQGDAANKVKDYQNMRIQQDQQQAAEEAQRRQDEMRAADQATVEEGQRQQRAAAKQGMYEKIGTGLGSVLGSAFGPVGTFVGGTLGDLAGLGLSKLF